MHYVVSYDVMEAEPKYKVFRARNDATAYFETACQYILRGESAPSRNGERIFLKDCRLLWSERGDVYQAVDDVKAGTAKEVDSFRSWNDRRCANIEF